MIKTTQKYSKPQNTLPALKAEKNPLKNYQGCLNAAVKGGVDILFARKFKGGDGKGNVKFIVIEQGWITDHESIKIKTFFDTGINEPEAADHGAAVMGIVLMKNNAVGGIGMVPEVDGYVISEWRPGGRLNLADAIKCAVKKLDDGDIILIESQVPDVSSPYKLWPVETDTAIFDAIRLATKKGIIVIEPAGNGALNTRRGNDLDLYEYKGRRNLDPCSLGFKDSGAIMVAAATSALPHKRISNSNYGSRVNCYAWGNKITTAGSFPKSSHGKTNAYTNKFGETSGASAIIAGAAIAVQNIAETYLNKRLSPEEMRSVLGSDLYGTASLNGIEKDRIGFMPDLKKIINKALKIKSPALQK